MEIKVSFPGLFSSCSVVAFFFQRSLLHLIAKGIGVLKRVCVPRELNTSTFVRVQALISLCLRSQSVKCFVFLGRQLTACPGYGQAAKACSVSPAAHVKRGGMLRCNLGSRGLRFIDLSQTLVHSRAA